MLKQSSGNNGVVLSLDYGMSSYAHIFTENGFEVRRQYSKDLKDVNLDGVTAVLFTGGTDVDPALYGQENLMSGIDPKRDDFEAVVWGTAKEKGLPCYGICRGAQFLTVMNGGTLVQDVKGHLGSHAMKTIDGEDIRVSSTHHQMMMPSNSQEHTVLAWAEHGHDKRGEKGRKVYQLYDPEVVYYHKTNDLAVQYHPEYMDPASRGYKYFIELVKSEV